MLTRCWCGNSALGEFSETYGVCADCGTLVSRRGIGPEDVEVHDDERDFYGKEYWFSRQRDELGFPDIYERARQDLPERCLHWLRTLLAYRLPPAQVLEVGSGHGGYVALLRAAGFEATGLELSPWVVKFAQTAFGVPMLRGPLEGQTLAPASLDVIVLNDVLEHLVEPRETMRRCAELLGPDGFVVAQTPCYPEGEEHAQLVQARHPFLAMLQEREHLHLFSRRAASRLFAEIGLPHVRFEPALFPYDMVVVASRHELEPTDPRRRDEVLLGSPAARFVKAMLDLDDRRQELGRRAEEVEGDRQERIAMIERLNRHIETTSQDYEARGQIIRDQQAAIDRVVAASEAQLKAIADQQGTIEKLLPMADLEARLGAIDARLQTIEALSARMQASWLGRILRRLCPP